MDRLNGRCVKETKTEEMLYSSLQYDHHELHFYCCQTQGVTDVIAMFLYTHVTVTCKVTK